MAACTRDDIAGLLMLTLRVARGNRLCFQSPPQSIDCQENRKNIFIHSE